MDEEVTIQEAMKILHRSEVVVRGYIKSGKLAGEKKADGKYYMLKSDVLRLAKNPGQIQVDKVTAQLLKVSRQLEDMEARLKAAEKQLETLSSQSPTQPTSYTSQPRRPQSDTTTTSNIPAGYVIYPHFLHGVASSTAKRWINSTGGFTVTEGTWKYGNHNVTKLLSSGQQREYWQAMHNHARFQACPDCPHEVSIENTESKY